MGRGWEMERPYIQFKVTESENLTIFEEFFGDSSGLAAIWF
jgi:hypothetical protein